MQTQSNDLGDFPGGLGVKVCTPNSRGTGLIPGQGTKIPHATWHGQKKSDLWQGCPRLYNGEEIISTNNVRKTGYLQAKEWNWTLKPYTYTHKKPSKEIIQT